MTFAEFCNRIVDTIFDYSQEKNVSIEYATEYVLAGIKKKVKATLNERLKEN